MVNSDNTDVITQENKIEIVASTSILADTINEIGKEWVSVTTLIGIGVDPHDYEPTPSHIQSLYSADYIFWIGAGVEENIHDVLHYWEEQGKGTAVIGKLDEEILIQDTDLHEGIDAHIWQDPTIWMSVVEIITKTLNEQFPNHAEDFSLNEIEYLDELQDIHDYIATKSSDLDHRFLVTQHKAFEYFGNIYNFTTQSLQGISTDTEPGIKEIEDLAIYLKENNINVIFSETTTPGSNMDAVINSANSIGHQVVLGGLLYSGSLGDSQAETYIDMLRYNADIIIGSINDPPEPEEEILTYPYISLISIFLVIPWIRKKR